MDILSFICWVKPYDNKLFEKHLILKIIKLAPTIRYYKEDMLHRDGDKPALIEHDQHGANCWWYIDGELHRDDDKPAVTRGNWGQEWYYHGKRHRVNGPATIITFWNSDGCTDKHFWFLHGKRCYRTWLSSNSWEEMVEICNKQEADCFSRKQSQKK